VSERRQMSNDKSKKGPEPRRVLGRGLDTLLPSVSREAAERVEQDYQSVPLSRIVPRAGQPRKRFDDEQLRDLAQSIREQGIIQPIVVRRVGSDLEIIAGERRWRAARIAGLEKVPVVIKNGSDDDAFEWALVENVQRVNLDPIEVAEAYRRLQDEHGYDHAEIADRVGKARTTITNSLRLLTLPEPVQQRVAAQELSEGHAKVLLTLAEQPSRLLALAQETADKRLSVRELETRVKRAAAKDAQPDPGEKPPPADKPAKSPNVRELESRLSAALGMPVVVREDPSKSSGTVEIAYDTLDHLDRFIEKILGR
jgi:ParB family chromosome partitioning protein